MSVLGRNKQMLKHQILNLGVCVISFEHPVCNSGDSTCLQSGAILSPDPCIIPVLCAPMFTFQHQMEAEGTLTLMDKIKVF